ncbi:MAG TPA: GNAT family protein [Patescibacteria group bacterium]|nr:GNAT family protein [Patescibacteria group bacterium]
MIKLETFKKEDFAQLIEWVDNERLLTSWAGALFRFPLTEESLEWYVEGTNDMANSDTFVYKAVDTETGETVGHISIGSISWTNKSARISRVLVGKTAARGKGICQQMINCILKLGFESLELHRISLGVYEGNDAAIRCYEKCGFKIEGRLRDVFLYEGDEYWTLVEMAILEDEWRELQKSEVQK